MQGRQQVDTLQGGSLPAAEHCSAGIRQASLFALLARKHAQPGGIARKQGQGRTQIDEVQHCALLAMRCDAMRTQCLPILRPPSEEEKRHSESVFVCNDKLDRCDDDDSCCNVCGDPVRRPCLALP